jgi:hypothetical protein
LPTGLTLSGGGVLSGTPAAAGSFSFTVTATDANSCSGNQAYTVAITAPSSSSTYLMSLGVAYSQNFDSLANTGTTNTFLPAGWALSESGNNANTSYAAGDGSSNSGNTWSYGSTSSTDRAFGGLLSSNLAPTIGAKFTNSTGSTITSLVLAYTGEEWRLGAANRTDTLKFQYSLDATSLTTGTWISATALNYLTTDIIGAAGARDGNDPTKHTAISSTISGLNIGNGSSFWIRWLDANASSSDDGLAVDDFLLTPKGSGPTNPSLIGSAIPSTVAIGSGTLLTATVTPGTGPASTGLAVTGDLSSIGGSSTQTLYDDGTHGDVTNGNNVFSFQYTIPSATTIGAKNLAVGVLDAQSRTGNGSISLTVSCPTITVSPSTVPNTLIGAPYSQNITASGGVQPYTFAISAGSLP